MSKMTKGIGSRFSVILALSVLLTWVVCVPTEIQAEPSPGIMRGGHAEHGRDMRDFAGHSLHRLLRHQKDLGLSEEQITKIKAIATDYAKTRIRGEADFKLAEVDVRTLVRDEKADLPAIEVAIKKSESVHTALRLERVKALRAATSVLTPEQRDKWRASMMERHMGRHRDGPLPGKHSAEEHGDGPMASPQDPPSKREG